MLKSLIREFLGTLKKYISGIKINKVDNLIIDHHHQDVIFRFQSQFLAISIVVNDKGTILRLFTCLFSIGSAKF